MELEDLLRLAAENGVKVIVITNSSVIISDRSEIVDVNIKNQGVPGKGTQKIPGQ